MTLRQKLYPVITVFAAVLFLAPPMGAVCLWIYRTLILFWPWDEGLMSFLIFVLMAYVFTGIPALFAALVLSFRTWQRGGFGYGFAVATALAIMTAYLAIISVLFKSELVRVVDGTLSMQILALTFCVASMLTYVLRWVGVIGRIKQ
jgi:hypothetical protein